MKTLFFGTPELAVPYLELLKAQTEVKAVITAPDEPSGRGYALHPPPVKEAAAPLGLPVLQPQKLKDPAFLAQMTGQSADMAVVVAYGKLLPPALLSIPRLGFLNVHFSLLPAYRGAAPVQRALMAGETQTGVTLFWLDEGMDTGPIFLQHSCPIDPSDNAGALFKKLVPLGLEALREALDRASRGDIQRSPQQGAASKAPVLKKEEGKIHWEQSATQIVNLMRGLTPSPGAFTFYPHEDHRLRLKILEAQAVTDMPPGSANAPGGTVVFLESPKGFIVKCGQSFLRIVEVQPEGRRSMSAWAFWQGARLKLGDKLE